MIRPFQFGDTFLLQRLQGQAPKLNVAQSLLLPRSPVVDALTSGISWNHSKVATYVLHQSGHGLARSGFLQTQRRPGRGELDLVMLAPALAARTGHPAIWEKLIAHCVVEATHEDAARLYADVPDQPLLVNTFAHVGFGVYARQTIWRLAVDDRTGPALRRNSETYVRPMRRSDEWELMRLYARVTPKPVQIAEGALAASSNRPPILDWWSAGEVQTLVCAEGGGQAQTLRGCLRIVFTRTGAWMELWADARRTDADAAQALLCEGLKVVQAHRRRVPIYVPVRDYHGGLGPLLSDQGFAPFADHAKMVKHLLQRVVGMESVRLQSVEPASEVVVTAGGYAPAPRIPAPGAGGAGRALPRHRSSGGRLRLARSHIALCSDTGTDHAGAADNPGPADNGEQNPDWRRP